MAKKYGNNAENVYYTDCNNKLSSYNGLVEISSHTCSNVVHLTGSGGDGEHIYVQMILL